MIVTLSDNFEFEKMIEDPHGDQINSHFNWIVTLTSVAATDKTCMGFVLLFFLNITYRVGRKSGPWVV